MLSEFFSNGSVLLNNLVQKDPSPVIGAIASVFGYLLNFFYNVSEFILPSDANTLGLAIILLTIASKIIVLPLSIKSQKSMIVMQKLQPEMEKIRKKYGDSKDPATQQKMNMEVQKLYSENKANPLMGCLPIFIQLPIFMALYSIMNQAYRYVDKLHAMYAEICEIIWKVPDCYAIIGPLAHPKLPNGMEIDLAVESDMIRVLGKFMQSDWNTLLAQLPADAVASIQNVLDRKSAIENFFGIVLTENTGLVWPSIIIPIICVVATFLSSYLSTRQTKSNDPNMKLQQNMMMVVMPVMIGFMTIGMPAGVGLYWAASNITQIVQQFTLNKLYNKPDSRNSDNGEIVDPKPVKGKSAGKKNR